MGWLKVSVFSARGDVYLAVDALFDALYYLVDADKLLNGHTHAVINARSVGVEQEVFRVDRRDLYRDAAFLHHTNGSLPSLTRYRLSGWLKDLIRLDHDLANASPIDFSHQLDLVDRFSNFVLLEVFHQLGFEHLDI